MTILDETRDILGKLVGFPTISESTSANLLLIEWVEQYLGSLGASMRRVVSAGDSKANLWVQLGGTARGGVVLSGHTDVVPVAGQQWRGDPFTLFEDNDRLYGRGTADMKGFLALALAFAPRWSRIGAPVCLAFTCDEEVGCLGAPDLIRDMRGAEVEPAMVWVGEPTEWRVVGAHKGVLVHEVVVTGRESHSSRPDDGVSAIDGAVELMAVLRALPEARSGTAAATDPTLTIGRVEGGEAANIIAGKCRFVFDLRLPPDRDAADILAPFHAAVERVHARIGARAPEGGVTVRKLCDAPPLAMDGDSRAVSFLQRLSGCNDVEAVAYAAEAGLFRQAGFPAAICGPGSIRQAHRPDEWIAVSELRRGIELFERLTVLLQAGEFGPLDPLGEARKG